MKKSKCPIKKFWIVNFSMSTKVMTLYLMVQNIKNFVLIASEAIIRIEGDDIVLKIMIEVNT